jgi:hypothetical protein
MFIKKSWKNIKLVASVFSAIVLTQLLGANTLTQAADTVVIRYGPL